MNAQKLNFIFVLFALILHFLAQQHVSPLWPFALAIVLLGCYFFPVNMILDLVKKKGVRATMLTVFSNFLCGTVLALSAVRLYIPDAPGFHNLYFGFIFVNSIFAFACYLFSLDNEKALLHMLTSLLYW